MLVGFCVRGKFSMAPCKDDRRAGQGTRLRLAEANLLLHRRAKSAEQSKKYREKKRASLQNTFENIAQSDLGTTISSMNIDRATSRVANEWALRWFHETSSRGLEFQKSLVPKNLKHAIWQPVFPSYTEMEVSHNAVRNISQGWQHIKGCHSTNDQRA